MEKTMVFPIERLPRKIGRIITTLADANKFSINYLSLSFLFALAVAIGRSRMAVLRTTWKVSPNLFCALVGEKSSVKTPVLRLATAPLSVLPDEDPHRRESDVAVANNTAKQIIAQDITIEALLKLHDHNPYGIGIVRDELAGVFNGFNRYNFAGGDEEALLSLYSCAPTGVNRKTGSERFFIENPCVGLTGTIQPRVLARLIANAKNNGFWERFIYVFDDLAGEPRQLDFDADDTAAAEAVVDWRWILYEVLSTGGFWSSDFSVREYPLAPEAVHLFQEWHNAREVALCEADPELLGAFRKLAEQMIKISLILQVAREVTHETDREGVIELASVENAIAIAEFLEGEAAKVRAIGAREESALRTAFLELLPDSFTTAEALQAVAQLGIGRRTFFDWVEKGYIIKNGRANYSKQDG